MSKQDIKVKTFPINNTHGTYNFRRMGEFEIYSSIGSGLSFSPMFLEQYQKGNKFPRALKHLIILLKYLKKIYSKKKIRVPKLPRKFSSLKLVKSAYSAK